MRKVLTTLLLCSSVFQAMSQDFNEGLYRKKDLEQLNAFKNNTAAFPPLPKSKWEIGVNFSYPTLIHDNDRGGQRQGFTPESGDLFSQYGFGVHVRKSLTYLFSIRADFNQTFTRKDRTGLEMDATTVSLDGIFSLNNLNFHKPNPKWGYYVFGGFTYMSYDAQRGATNFSSDNVFPRPDFGAGISRRLGKRASLNFESKWIATFGDGTDADLVGTNSDILGIQKLGISFFPGRNVKSAGTYPPQEATSGRVDPLYWGNPMSYIYNELNEPKHMKLPKQTLADGDGDGVTDQFDKEPNTPAGTPVDVNGVARDTDGDGVPDFRDKELVTPTSCQPVDADGVGKCPDPACCKNAAPTCGLGNLPSVSFASASTSLSNDAKSSLTNAAAEIRNNPACKVVVESYGGASKKEQQLSWERTNSVINYLVEKEGISRDRFIFRYAGQGDANTVDLRAAAAGEEGPNSVPRPGSN